MPVCQFPDELKNELIYLVDRHRGQVPKTERIRLANKYPGFTSKQLSKWCSRRWTRYGFCGASNLWGHVQTYVRKHPDRQFFSQRIQNEIEGVVRRMTQILAEEAAGTFSATGYGTAPLDSDTNDETDNSTPSSGQH